MEGNRKKQFILICLFLAFSTLLTYWPVTHFDFVHYDDTDFVTANPHVQAGFTADSIKWAFNIHTEVARNWHPITLLTHMADCEFFKLKAGWHHFDNLLLHIANTLLLFYLLQLMTGAVWRSAMVAALFALHPLHVESVAWVSERKDVLSTLFWLLTMWAYARYAAANSKVYYILAILFCALGLMSKPMLVSLPFVLLLMDYWPLRRFAFGAKAKKTEPATKGKKDIRLAPPVRALPPVSRLILEKVPFFILSATLCVITYWVQKQGGAMLSTNNLPLGSRVSNALISYVRYLGNMFWPHDLSALYLRYGDWPDWEVALAALLLAGITVAAVMQTRKRPYFTIGWFWYVGTLVPVIGVVQVGMQAMADRFTYVPMIGLFVALSWGATELVERWKLPRSAPWVAAAVCLGACMILTSRQVGYWKDSETLFKRMIAVSERNYMAHYNLANTYSREKRTAEAIEQYELAVKWEPNYADAHNNLAGVLLEQKRYDEAIQHYREAIRINSIYTHYFNLANAYADAGRFPEAESAFRQALQMNPQASEVHNNFGMTLQAEKKDNEAIVEFAAAVSAKPDLEVAHFNLASALSRVGRQDEAIVHFEAAKQLKPDRSETYNGLGMCYAMEGKMEPAAEAFKELIQLRPDDSGAYGNLGNALSAQNRIDEAIPYYLKAMQLNPGDYQTEFNLGLSYSKQGKVAEAREHYLDALKIKPDYTDAKRALEMLGK